MSHDPGDEHRDPEPLTTISVRKRGRVVAAGTLPQQEGTLFVIPSDTDLRGTTLEDFADEVDARELAKATRR